MKLSDNIISILEYNEFDISEIEKQDDGYYVDISQYTPEGEDWYETIWFDGTDNGFIEAVQNVSRNFDVDEAVEIWIPSMGKNGVPDSIKALIEDAEWKKEQLEVLADELSDVYIVQNYNGQTVYCPDCGTEITIEFDTARCEECGWMCADAELDELMEE